MNKMLLASVVSIGLLAFNFVAKKHTEQSAKSAKIERDFEKRLLIHVSNVKQTIAKNPTYNPDVAFFIDMKIHSGKNRFFVYDLKADKIIDQGLVAHGSGSETGIEGQLKFSNVSQSLCTSLGQYTIGESYIGRFGKAYKLRGLDNTNSNAYARNIVLHKYDPMPEEEQSGPIVNSYGCPTLSEKYFQRIEKILDGSEKTVLLDIYY
jgi:hypothetical protein